MSCVFKIRRRRSCVHQFRNQALARIAIVSLYYEAYYHCIELKNFAHPRWLNIVDHHRSCLCLDSWSLDRTLCSIRCLQDAAPLMLFVFYVYIHISFNLLCLRLTPAFIQWKSVFCVMECLISGRPDFLYQAVLRSSWRADRVYYQ